MLGRERAEAESDPSALARYRAFRLNHASDPIAARVFSASELMTVCARPAAARVGAPVLSIDTGGLLSMSAACAIWPDSGRIELWAIAGPGASVTLTEADGLFVGPAEVPPVGAILARVAGFPEPPSLVVGDPHRFAELQEWARSRGIRCALRGGRSSNLVGDVQAARRLLLDDGAAFALGAPLLQLAASEVSLTGDGRSLKKTGQGRDDPLRAFVLCCRGCPAARRAAGRGRACGAARVVKRMSLTRWMSWSPKVKDPRIHVKKSTERGRISRSSHGDGPQSYQLAHPAANPRRLAGDAGACGAAWVTPRDL